MTAKKISPARRLAGRYFTMPLESFEQIETNILWKHMVSVCGSLLGNDVAVKKKGKK